LAQQATVPSVLRLEAETVATSDQNNLLLSADRTEALRASSAQVLQLKGPITPAQRAELLAAGVTMGDYLPDHAYIVDARAADPDVLVSLPYVNWLGDYQNAWKLDPTIGARLAPFVSPERIAHRSWGQYQLAVTLLPWADVDKSITELQAHGATVAVEHEVGGIPLVGVTIDQDRLGELGTLPFVQYIEESAEITLRNSSDRWIVQSNVLNVTPFYDAGIHGEGQIVGIVDGKVNVNHCSFSDSNPIGPTHRKILAYNTSLGSDSHGTHVAGTACGDNGVNDDTRGVAYLAKFVFNDIPSFTETAIDTTLTTHHNQGARIHTNSWGDDGTTQYNGLARGFDVFLYNHEESMVCLAVTNQSSLKNPENAKNLLAVGASQDAPNQGNFCSGGTGPTADGRRKPEIFAPGCGTNSADAFSACGTTAKTGTSMATPAIAGAALLVRQYYVDGYYPTGAPVGSDAFTPSGALVKATLLNSAVDMDGISGYPSNQEGWGRVLADNAVYFPGDTRNAIVLDDIFNANGLSTGQTADYQFSVASAGETLRLTLVFTDAPGASGSSNPVVNNLDLELVTPNGAQTYKGNNISGGLSSPGGAADPINNVEQIIIANPPTGLWTAHVKATAVNQGTQGYALVASGDVNLGPLPPVAEDVAVETPIDTPITVQLDASDVDFDPLDYIIASLPASGTLSDPQGGVINTAPYTLLNNGSQVDYTPPAAFVGHVGFVYRADDGGVPPDGGQSNAAAVDILVKADAPQILSTALPDGQIGAAYGPEQIAVSGGQPPLSWQIVADVPYLETDLGTNAFAEVGVAQGWQSDDQRWAYNLPFSFPFYNASYAEAYVWSNGMIDFVVPHQGNSHNNSNTVLLENRRIAPLWDDLVTTGAGDDIFIDDTVPGTVTIRWHAHTYAGAHPVSVAVTLHESGAIDFHYGPDNASVTPTIGVSDGDGTRYTLSGYNDATNLAGVNSVRFEKPAQLADGLALDAGGAISGTPLVAGEYLPIVRVTDSLNRTDEAALPLLIRSIPGDFDMDGDVDGADLLVFTDCLGGPMTPPPAVGPPPAATDCLAVFDFDDDGRVDLVDFAALQGAMAP